MLQINPEDFILKPYFATIHCEPDWEWKKREQTLPNYDLFYIWGGEGTVFVNGKSYNVQKGHCFLFKPGDQPTATHNPKQPLVLTYIHFDLMKTPQMMPALHRIISNNVIVETLLAQYIHLLLVKDYGAEIEAKLILKQLMIHLLREEQESSRTFEFTNNRLIETIQEIAHYIDYHPEEPYTIQQLALRANLSPRYFSLKFKQIIGQTVRSYIVQSRIKRAEHLLHCEGMPVSDVAYTLGYNDLHFFSRQFKKFTGKSPSEVR